MDEREGSSNRQGSRPGAVRTQWVRHNPISTAASSQRTYSSGPGTPEKPPMSGPLYATPESPRFTTVGICWRNDDHVDSLSPVHIHAHAWIPAQPDRDRTNGRRCG